MRRATIFSASLLLLCVLPAAMAQQRQEIQFPDVPGYHTLKCDFHAHTVFSDGLVWPTVRTEEAWHEGLDAIALSDHIEYQPHKQDLPTNHNRPCELAAGSAAQHNLILIRGAEITRDTPPGHFNAIFLSDINPLDTEDFYAVFDQAAQQQAFVFWNHPGWQGLEKGRWGPEQTQLLEKKQLQGIEVCNGDTYYPEAHQYAMEKGLTMLGDSDIHEPSPFSERTPTNHRTLTLVFAKERTEQGLHDALLAGRTAVWFENQLIGREPELAPLYAACVEIDPPHHRSGNKVWVEIKNGCELDIELERVGTSGPAKITLPAHTTSLVRLDVPAEELAKGLPYRAVNFLIGPNEPLPIKLVIPHP